MNRVQNTKLVLWLIAGFAAAVGINRFIFGFSPFRSESLHTTEYTIGLHLEKVAKTQSRHYYIPR